MTNILLQMDIVLKQWPTFSYKRDIVLCGSNGQHSLANGYYTVAMANILFQKDIVWEPWPTFPYKCKLYMSKCQCSPANVYCTGAMANIPLQIDCVWKQYLNH